LRLGFIVGAFWLLQPEGSAAFPWLAAITPGALFLLMMLFWRLDDDRYGAYGTLYLAGKGIGIVTALFWFFLKRIDIMTGPQFVVLAIAFFLVLGDAVSLLLVARIAGFFDRTHI
jgi:hypothetical protein